jgi:homocitrate synthase NifV
LKKKAGVPMRRIFTFVDQTLSYALRTGRIDIPKFMSLKREMTTMAQLVFDLPLNLLEKSEGQAEIDLHDVRLGIAPDMSQVKLASKLGCSQVKLKLEAIMVAKTSQTALDRVFAETQKRGMQVTVHGIKVGKYTLPEIVFLKKMVERYSIDHLVVDDSDSRLDPLSTYWTLSELQALYSCELEYCGRNKLGLATGNALGAVKSGVRRMVGSIGGIGGFPAWEEVWMSIKHLMKYQVNIPADLAVCCQGILAGIGETISMTKPIIGSNIFAHESGIHVDGVIKKSELYEPFAPEDVGLLRKIIIGKHSGKAAIELKLKELNIELEALDVSRVLDKVRQLAVAQKAPLINEQLQELVKEVKLNANGYC